MNLPTSSNLDIFSFETLFKMKLAQNMGPWFDATFSLLTKCSTEFCESKGFASKFLTAALVTTLLCTIAVNSFGQDLGKIDDSESVPSALQVRPTTVKNPAVIEFKGPIDWKLTTYFKNRFALAKKAGVDLLIVEIDSPGGLKNESLEMARMLRDCNWAYTIAMIDNEAISGGALVSLGCDEIQINPNAKYGDIGIIQFDENTRAFRFVEPKIESYLVRDACDLAESKGRPKALAESMIDKDVLVYRKVDEATGDTEFKTVRVDAVVKPDAPWQLIPETGPERFLTLSGQRTIELELGQGTFSTREKLANEFNFSNDDIRVYKMTTTDSVVYYLNAPLITGLLILVGLISLYVELSSPVLGVGGLLSGLCAILFFWSKFLGGTSGWLEVILFVAGIVFLFTEVFVIPGFGIPGITGLALLFSSVLLASQDFVVPQTANQWNQSITSAMIMVCTGIGFIGCAAFISKRLGSIPLFNKLVLAPPPIEEKDFGTDKEGKPIPQPHPSVSVGDWGTAESLLRPAGRAKFGFRSFDVISDGSYVESGSQVRVIKITGNVITVTQVDPESVPESERAS